ncbi:hypothetical protein KC921_03240 [Candidatus Woesebacteria bacterium]|nr:hypothetical protein [Candidatus Woesebacteria bacterium]
MKSIEQNYFQLPHVDYPLLRTTAETRSLETAGVIVAIINLDSVPKILLEFATTSQDNRVTFNQSEVLAELDNIEVWLIREATLKPNEATQLQPNLVTPPQETRRWGESLISTLSGALVEELPHHLFETNQDNTTTFVYVPRFSYLGSALLPHPKPTSESSFDYRADYFLLGCRGVETAQHPKDSEAQTFGWMKISEFLDDSPNQDGTGFQRRQGGKAAILWAKENLLPFLAAYVQNPEVSSYNRDHILAQYQQRDEKNNDFKRPFPQELSAVTSSFQEA